MSLDHHHSLSPAVEVSGLTVVTAAGHEILHDVAFSLRRGETLGLVGESGSGKTTLALALLGYAQGGAQITAGRVHVAGAEVDLHDERVARGTRGDTVAYVPQNPGTALNPALRIGAAIREMLQAHGAAETDDTDPAGTRLARVNLASDSEFQRRYPHQLSGGQQQRVCIAVALACDPPVIVLDEPTTGLDVVTQEAILDELVRLRRERELSMVYVTHDLAVVASVADRIAVMYGGRIVEDGSAREILAQPHHPYTRGLLNSIPDHTDPRELEPMPGVAVGIGQSLPGCRFAPRCTFAVDACQEREPDLDTVNMGHRARCIRASEVAKAARVRVPRTPRTTGDAPPALVVSHLGAEHQTRHGVTIAASDISFTVPVGGCVALVGESGSGKTTIARAIAGLHPISSGKILYGAEELKATAHQRTRQQRRAIQLIFQNPGDALNPRRSIGAAVARPAELLRRLSAEEASTEVSRLLELVRLPENVRHRYPGELSGGERQRVCIARALAADPAILICDEITSALDVSVQAAVLDLLQNLRSDLGLAILFITHDLGVVAAVADEVLVLEHGRVCEAGTSTVVLRHPSHAYTQRLLEAAPSISHAVTA